MAISRRLLAISNSQFAPALFAPALFAPALLLFAVLCSLFASDRASISTVILGRAIQVIPNAAAECGCHPEDEAAAATEESKDPYSALRFRREREHEYELSFAFTRFVG